MKVQQIENFNTPNLHKKIVTDEQLQNDYNYYMAQKLLEIMLMHQMITDDEFNKITERNRQTFSPYLAEIMP